MVFSDAFQGLNQALHFLDKDYSRKEVWKRRAGEGPHIQIVISVPGVCHSFICPWNPIPIAAFLCCGDWIDGLMLSSPLFRHRKYGYMGSIKSLCFSQFSLLL